MIHIRRFTAPAAGCILSASAWAAGPSADQGVFWLVGSPHSTPSSPADAASGASMLEQSELARLHAAVDLANPGAAHQRLEEDSFPLIALPSASNEVVYAEPRELHRRSDSDWSLHGDLVGTLNGHFVLVSTGHGVFGSIYRDGRRWDLWSAPASSTDSSLVLSLVETDESVECASAAHGDGPSPAAPGRSSSTQGRSFDLIDMLVIYTEDVRAAIGDLDGDGVVSTRADVYAQALADAARFDLTCDNSGVLARVGAIHLWEVDSSHNVSQDFGDLAGSEDGVMDELPLLRDRLQADLASFWIFIGSSGPTGHGHIWNGDDSQCWTLLSAARPIGGGPGVRTAFVHETGHNLGCAHDRGDPDTDPPNGLPWSHGFVGRNAAGSIVFTTAMAAGTYKIPHYSNPDVLYTTWQGEDVATGIDHDLDPANSADCARTIAYTAPQIAAFRTGEPDLSDCDADGVYDYVAMFYGSDPDRGGLDLGNGAFGPNGLPDSCDRAAWASDCAGAAADPALVEWNVRVERPFRHFNGNGDIRVAEFRGLRQPESDVTVTVGARASFIATSRWVDVYVNDTHQARLFVNGQGCNGVNQDEFTIPVEDIELGTGGSLAVRLEAVGLTAGCVLGTQQTFVRVEYASTHPEDLDRDGILDACDPGCSPADIQAPFGVVDFADIQSFLNLYSAMAAQADIAAPLGVWNFWDVQAFLHRFAAGCP